MRSHQDLEDAKAKRKSLKPQVERWRRERINRSLETLKTLLLQQQEETQRRVEKAEILEHTVLFLQNAANKTTAGAAGQNHSFHDGFSTCLQRAAQFLGPEREGQRLGEALEASFAARFSRADSDPADSRAEAHSSSRSLLLRKSSRSILRLLIHRSRHRLCTQALSAATCGQTHGEPGRAQTTHQRSHMEVNRASTQSPQQCHPVSRSLWRPWP